ncbi:protein of unknown function [Methylorubrum extorquens]|uniref:Uncharacterized protein n=1 Tax=Methylorubrum extorquens TaxID=408 RepID=A0A2N9AQS2_METEX|nr:protein of unknown function [Methylorubrum extorquens]
MARRNFGIYTSYNKSGNDEEYINASGAGYETVVR